MGEWKHRLTEVDLEAKIAVCSSCGPTSIYVSGGNRRCVGARKNPPARRPGTHWMIERNGETGVCSTCGPVTMTMRKGSLGCPNRGARPEELKMRTALKKAIRDGKPCEICGELREHMVLDHKHGEKTWRGILCNKHNTGLGMFDDDSELLQAAIDYLLKQK